MKYNFSSTIILLVALLRETTECFCVAADLRRPLSSRSYATPSMGRSSNSTSTTITIASPVAIVLNTNARSVTKDLIPLAQQVLGSNAVFTTTTAEQAQDAARELIQQNVSLVVPVGGDGTLSSLVNFMVKHIRSENHNLTIEHAMQKLPVMGYIPMGTGNGVGSVVGCRAPSDSETRRPGLWKRLFQRKRLRQEQFTNVLELLQSVGQELHQGIDYCSIIENVDQVELPMMELTTTNRTHGDLCFFAGAGFDSLMLQDFKDLKAWSLRRNFLPQVFGSVAGYCVALVCKTLPKCIRRSAHQVQVTITSNDRETSWVDHRRGDVVQPLREKLVYNGTAGIVAAGYDDAV